MELFQNQDTDLDMGPKEHSLETKSSSAKQMKMQKVFQQLKDSSM